MSQAHRPTWNPTQGRETKAGSQQVAKHALASHTKLKFRQAGQNTSSDIGKRDLKAELAAAERAAQEKKRKAAGLPPLPVNASSLRIENGNGDGGEDGEGESAKRRKVLEEALDLDKDDSSDEEEEEKWKANGDKGKGKAVVQGADDDGKDEDEDDEDDDDSDDESDEDETAALMAELAKIKQERAEEKARLDAENAAAGQRNREEEIATGNPLLNLQAALGQTPFTTSRSAAPTFAVQRRWDDDLIFKNQSTLLDDKGKKGEFVNDLLRSEFHKKFMLKYIK